MSMNVDGLISGLGTTDLINQLMQLERQPQVRLQASLKALDAKTAVYRDLNTRFAAVGDAAEALLADGAWSTTKASSSATSRATATSDETAVGASLTFSVRALATAHTIVAETAVGLDDVVATGPIQLTIGGVAADPIDVGDGTLQSVVAAINAADAGVRAVAVQTSPGQYRLQLTATATGATTIEVDPTNLTALQGDGDADAFDVVIAGRDAEILVGGPGGYSVTSPSNTFADLLPGVDVTVHQADEDELVTISVADDVDARSAQVKKLVDALNGALSFVNANAAYNSTTKTGGSLTGDSLARSLQNAIYDVVHRQPLDAPLASVGIRLERNGTLTFDEAAFKKALATDPETVADVFTGASTPETDDGLAVRFRALAERATDSADGMISLAIQSKESQARSITTQIESWDVRLDKREAALRRQFAAMETALSNLRNQSTWLAGQIAGLVANTRPA